MFFSTVALADGTDDLERLIGGSVEGKASAVVKRMEDGDAIRLTSNKDQIIRLDKDAVSVIVNNPDHAAIMLDSPRVLIVMPRQPGATSFKVLDARGDIILEKDVIVTNAQPQYVRVRRVCGADDRCVPAAYYYCPDGCYEVTPVAPGDSSVPPPAASAATAAASMAPAPAATDSPSADEGEISPPADEEEGR